MSIPTIFNPMGAVYAPANKIYRPLQYLESSGTQSIKTGVSLNKGNYSAQLDMQCTAAGGAFGLPAGAQNMMSGCAVEVLQDGFRLWLTDTTISLNPFARRTYGDEFNKSTKKHTFGADSVSGSVTMGAAAITGMYYLFGNLGRNGASMRIYSAKIYQAGVLVRDYVPMLDPDGVPCMFDRVAGVPYYNAGTGDFTYAL